MNFSILTERFKVFVLRRGISSIYIPLPEFCTLFVINILKFIFMFYDQLLFLNLYGNLSIISSSHKIVFKVLIFCKGIIWLNLELRPG